MTEMRESELRANSTCSLCGQKIGEAMLFAPIFFLVRVETFTLDTGAVTRQQGLAMMLGGNGVLARAMGPDEVMARTQTPATNLVVCATCAMSEHAIVSLAARGMLEPTVEVTDGATG